MSRRWDEREGERVEEVRKEEEEEEEGEEEWVPKGGRGKRREKVSRDEVKMLGSV